MDDDESLTKEKMGTRIGNCVSIFFPVVLPDRYASSVLRLCLMKHVRRSLMLYILLRFLSSGESLIEHSSFYEIVEELQMLFAHLAVCC